MKTFSVNKVGLHSVHHFDGFEAHFFDKSLLKKQNLYVYLGDGKEFPRITHGAFWIVYLLINLTF